MLKVRSVEFELSAVRPAQWPADGLPEFAFVGRSNVGKSSLLNRLLNRKSLARVSAKPGKTQQINFFRINELFRFADLPGYGYASASKTDRARFANMVETYLSNREPLCQVFHLVDIRHEPSLMDVEVHAWMTELGLPITVVATKQDKIPRSRLASSVKRIRETLETSHDIFTVSAEKMLGLDALLDVMMREVELVRTSIRPSEPASEGDVLVRNHHTQKNQEAPQLSEWRKDIAKS